MSYRIWLFTLALAATIYSASGAEILIPLNSPWKYKKGTEEASAPRAAWRALSYNDSSWTTGNTPVYYGENLGPGTVLTDMRNNYTTVYLRKTFQLTDASDVARLGLRVLCDDGFIIWINGYEVSRFNVPSGDLAYNRTAQGAIEMTWITNSLTRPSEYLLEGSNVVAVHLFNANLTSSDIVFNLQLDSVSDSEPPRIISIDPAPGQVEDLREVTVTFSEPVQGVDPQDLLINNSPATALSGSGAAYTFSFPRPDYGSVDLTWDDGHFIQDFADPPHDFDHEAAGASWTYELRDTTAPTVLRIHPPPGRVVRALSEIEVVFSEEVQGAAAASLRINGVPATSIRARPANTFIFEFPGQPPGPVTVFWNSNHPISDHAIPPNPLAAPGWSYTVDPDAASPRVIISEFLARREMASAPVDEDGDRPDWIELHNTEDQPVNLEGWSLTDDDGNPGLWTFPSVIIPADGRLVVFASGKDRRDPSGPLHANFALSADREYLALFNADSPRQALTEFPEDYPEQRSDYSYGIDSLGIWRYFREPTPGAPNSGSAISGIVAPPEINLERGTYDEPFDLILSHPMPGVTIRYTLNGDPPIEDNGEIYTGPIRIDRTTVLRAAAYAPFRLPSRFITHTYIFFDQVLRQPNNPPGFPAGPAVMSGYPSDYEMDPEIVNHPAYRDEMRAALEALPVLSVVMKTDDMFGPVNGIYTHPLSRGPLWERPCSLEFMPIEGQGFQINAGIQVQGNASREPIKTPKHPFRLLFKRDYGPGTLQYRLFPDSPAREFNTVVLRADFGYSWLHWTPNQRLRAQRTRDAWMKDSLRAMGGLAGRNRYLHLFINGLYWGIYDAAERPDSAFAATYMGGQKEDYDAINEGQVVDGTLAAYQALLAISNLGDPSQYRTMLKHLDMTQFIDYMLLQFYVGAEDWGNNKNWYAVRPRDGSSGLKYLPWDGENILIEPGFNRVNNSDVPSGLHTRLLASAEYRLAFADRVQKHFFGQGALTPLKTAERWNRRADEMELPILAESARWGDYRRDVHSYQTGPYYLYTRDDQYRAEQNRLLDTYFPNRTATVLSQLRNAGLYSSVTAPSFSREGGLIGSSSQLSITSPGGTIYYTTNGIDPRAAFTGQPAPEARSYTGPLSLDRAMLVKARVLQNGAWSALVEAAFAERPGIPLRITELMYHPYPSNSELEFLEIQNVGPTPVDAGGYYLTGIDYIFPIGTILEPGEIILLASDRNPAAFSLRYPELKPLGYFGGQLSNGGERIALLTASGQTIVSVDYRDDNGWPEQADGEGYSLEIIDPWGDPDDPANWQASAHFDGTPGLPNSSTESSPVFINELLAVDPDSDDWLELHNSSDAEVDLSGWRLIDPAAGEELVLPPGTSIEPDGYLVIHCDRRTGAPGLHAPFALNSEAETIVLLDHNDRTASIVTYGPQTPGWSLSRIDGEWRAGHPTPGAPNQEAETAPRQALAINELLAAPLPGEEDWLEIYNRDPERPASLRGLFIQTSSRLFEITSHSFVPPLGFARFYADENPGPNHLDLKLPAAGTELALLDPQGTPLDGISYTDLPAGHSLGRFPDGSPNLILFPIPTPRAPNRAGFELDLVRSGDFLRLTWQAAPGQLYRVEHSASLSPPAWSLVTEINADSEAAEFDAALTGPAGYYRVVLPVD